ncbi:MAG: DNA sulfur modification protein DndB [Methanofastidiosum sp.]
MLKEKQHQLKEKLKLILNEVGHINEIKQEIGKDFKTRNLSVRRAMNVYMGIESLDTLNDSENDIRFLFLFTNALVNAARNKTDIEINAQDYFTKLEYNKWINFKAESKPENIFPLVFENVQQIADGIWQTTITAQRLAKLDTDNVLLYNFLTQRNPKITISGIKIDFDKHKAFEIRDRILSGEQFPDHIKINILKNYQEEIYYKNSVLTIGEKSIINMFDGHHRKVANSLAINDNPNLEFIWGLIITNLSENEAKDYMIQIDKQKPIKREQIKSWDLSRKENLVVSVIADDKISKLNKIMKDQEVEIRLNKALTTKNIIAEAIKDNYEIDETTDIRELGKWIIEFTDYLISLYPEEFITNPYAYKESSVINHKNIFYGYIALSASLRYNNRWKEVLKHKMQSIDFSKENAIWKDMGLYNRTIGKTLRKKLYKLFTEV